MHCLPKELEARSDAYDITEVWANYHIEYEDWQKREREREQAARRGGSTRRGRTR